MPQEAAASEPGWVITQGMSGRDLLNYVERFRLAREQVIQITESSEGRFRIIYDATPEQYAQQTDEIARLTARILNAPDQPPSLSFSDGQ